VACTMPLRLLTLLSTTTGRSRHSASQLLFRYALFSLSLGDPIVSAYRAPEHPRIPTNMDSHNIPIRSGCIIQRLSSGACDDHRSDRTRVPITVRRNCILIPEW
ncbi:hypothetical protein EI94DRAFT_1744820, partial [Lactarius quietus]